MYLGHPNIVVTYTHHLGAARVTFGSTFFIFLHITLGCLENKKCYFDLTQEWKNSKRYKSFWIFSEFGFPCWKIKEQEFSKLLWSFFTPPFCKYYPALPKLKSHVTQKYNSKQENTFWFEVAQCEQAYWQQPLSSLVCEHKLKKVEISKAEDDDHDTSCADVASKINKKYSLVLNVWYEFLILSVLRMYKSRVKNDMKQVWISALLCFTNTENRVGILKNIRYFFCSRFTFIFLYLPWLYSYLKQG